MAKALQPQEFAGRTFEACMSKVAFLRIFYLLEAVVALLPPLQEAFLRNGICGLY